MSMIIEEALRIYYSALLEDLRKEKEVLTQALELIVGHSSGEEFHLKAINSIARKVLTSDNAGMSNTATTSVANRGIADDK